MTHWTEAADLLAERDERRLLARLGPGALALVLSAALGVWLLYGRTAGQSPSLLPAEVAKTDNNPFGGLAPVTPAPTTPNPYGGLVLQGFGAGARFELAEREVPLPPVPPADLRSLDVGVPLPPRRPSDLARSVVEPGTSTPPVVARVEPKPAVPVTSPAGPNLIDRIFGKASPSVAATPEVRLAYAAPSSVGGVSSALASRGGLTPNTPGGFLRGLTFGSNPTARFGERVAVYDISARVVYLPDGTRIEAHSGLGEARDDPSKVHERMRGPTPPATYALTPREELFHGVAALRLTPVDGDVFGRAGLLAHTYMLGADGDSNGCISFRDYDAFLHAYRNGQVNKLVVVTRL